MVRSQLAKMFQLPQQCAAGTFVPGVHFQLRFFCDSSGAADIGDRMHIARLRHRAIMRWISQAD
jgi:hypothetical protein